MVDFQVAFDKLATIQSAPEMADFFIEQGVKGVKAKHDRCPIACWMSAQTGQRVSAAGYIVTLDSTDIASATAAMLDFMSRFDEGFYPELEYNHE